MANISLSSKPQKTSEYSSVLIFHGPGMERQAEAEFNFYNKYHENVFTFGDGKEELNTEEITADLFELTFTNKIGHNPLIVYDMHGRVDKVQGFRIYTGNSDPRYTIGGEASGKEFAGYIHKSIKQNFDIILYSCHSGELVKEIEELSFIKRVFATSDSSVSTSESNTQLVNEYYLHYNKEFSFDKYVFTSLSNTLINTFPVIYDRSNNFEFKSLDARGFALRSELTNYLFKEVINYSNNWEELAKHSGNVLGSPKSQLKENEAVPKNLIIGGCLVTKGLPNNEYYLEGLKQLDKFSPKVAVDFQSWFNCIPAKSLRLGNETKNNAKVDATEALEECKSLPLPHHTVYDEPTEQKILSFTGSLKTNFACLVDDEYLDESVKTLPYEYLAAKYQHEVMGSTDYMINQPDSEISA